MSWLSAGLSQLSEKLQDKVQKASESVQNAIPLDKELLAKWTLNTEEMKAERQQFGEEAKHRAAVKNMLAGMLPWETKDQEREILVDEAKEAILALSSNEETFFGPYEMPMLNVKVEDEAEESADAEEGDDDDEDKNVAKEKDRKPAAESLEKLAKLEPLPPLLRDFDLDAHVGLIQRLLKEDPQLSKMQSTLSGGGDREKVFWHNYFFHCAFTRYEAGLSIDEIWSFQPEKAQEEHAATESHDEATAEETVVFDGAGDGEGATADTPEVTAGEVDSGDKTPTDGSFLATAEGNSQESEKSEFEMVDDDGDVGTGDPELDELEAEIARELED